MRVSLSLELPRRVARATVTGSHKEILGHFSALVFFLEDHYSVEIWTKVRRLTPPNNLTQTELMHLLADLYHSLVTNRKDAFELAIWRWGERIRDRDHVFACQLVDRLTGPHSTSLP